MSVPCGAPQRGSPRPPSECRCVCRTRAALLRGGPPDPPLRRLHVGYTHVGRAAAPRPPSGPPLGVACRAGRPAQTPPLRTPSGGDPLVRGGVLMASCTWSDVPPVLCHGQATPPQMDSCTATMPGRAAIHLQPSGSDVAEHRRCLQPAASGGRHRRSCCLEWE